MIDSLPLFRDFLLNLPCLEMIVLSGCDVSVMCHTQFLTSVPSDWLSKNDNTVYIMYYAWYLLSYSSNLLFHSYSPIVFPRCIPQHQEKRNKRIILPLPHFVHPK